MTTSEPKLLVIFELAGLSSWIKFQSSLFLPYKKTFPSLLVRCGAPITKLSPKASIECPKLYPFIMLFGGNISLDESGASPLLLYI